MGPGMFDNLGRDLILVGVVIGVVATLVGGGLVWLIAG